MILLRGHFGFVKSADLYLDIAGTHINPCLRMAANLPLSASPDDQSRAKEQLQQATEESAAAIKKLAQKELDEYHKQLEDRCQEIETELQALPSSTDNTDNLKAIEDGVKESSGEMAEENELKRGLYDEIMDDI
ncbi:hypothetical protein HD806DRAFT_351559 [Xylariaceae sp. AK1471]|nr:hypothetical protein HD806DRAFT_351559 [Xylariaceae sp. AK1471]